MANSWGGVWPALLTPFAANGEPAYDVLERLVELYAHQQLDGLYITGSTGQWPLLTMEERRRIAECVVSAAGGRLPVMVHVGAAATEQAVSLARHAAKIGADAVSSVAPIYYGHSAAVVFEYYRRVGQATDLPLYVYHFQPEHRLAISAGDYVQGLLNIPNIAGMKITDRDLYLFGQLHAFAGERLTLFSGADELMCHAVLSGAVGAIGTFYNLWGPACKLARGAMFAGDWQAARRFMLRFQAAISHILASGSVWSFLWEAMRQQYELDIGSPRAPLGTQDRPWDAAEVQRIVQSVSMGL